jgi:RNA polymerase sigma factor (sigma-70 family)
MQTQETWTKEKPETPDSVLVQQALAGHQEAFETLVNRYEQSLLGLINFYVGEYHEAQNVLQQVWLQLYLSLATLRQNGRIKPWLFTVARNRSLDILRSTRLLSFSELERGNEVDEATCLDTLPDTSPTLDELADNRDLQQAIQPAILALPHMYRAVVLLSYGEQLTFTEIGRILKMSRSTGKTQFHRAKPFLRAALVCER